MSKGKTKEPQPQYEFSVWSFSDQEIEQIVELTRLWASGSNLPINRKRQRLSKAVVEYAVSTGLLIWRCKHGIEDERRWGDCERCRTRSENWRLVVPKNLHRFNCCYDLPNEALWRIVNRDILGGRDYVGYSAADSRGWYTLNIYPERANGWTRRDLEDMLHILTHLDVAGYVSFQCCGNVWDLRPRVA
jgi:hypothetical protein